MPSDGFSGFDEWLDFRVEGALASIEGHGKGRGRKIVRARPLSVTSSGHGLWVLADGEHPPIPFLLNSAPGPTGSFLGWATDEIFEPWKGAGDDAHGQYGDALVKLIADLLKTRCGRSGVRQFDLVVDAPRSLTHAILGGKSGEESGAQSEQEGFQGGERESHLIESFESAWSRCFDSNGGPATSHSAWRLAQGETLIDPSFTARAVTTLSDSDDPYFSYDTNLWGQSSSENTSIWLIEADGCDPFLFLFCKSCSPCHGIDEVETSTFLSAKGVGLWRERSDINDDSRDEPNMFTELHERLPEVKQSGFGFTLGEPVRIHLDPVFECDANPWLNLVEKPWADEQEDLQRVWACIHEQQLSQDCPLAAISTATAPRPRL